MRFIGRRDGVSDELQERMDWAEAETARQRPDHAVRRLQLRGPGRDPGRRRARSRAGARRTSGEGLYAPEMHDPDLLIRTSGEQRISNYLLWQCAYSEFVFRDELWPDFGREAFEDSLRHLRGAPAALRGPMTPRWTTSIRRLPFGRSGAASREESDEARPDGADRPRHGARPLPGGGGGAAADQGRAGRRRREAARASSPRREAAAVAPAPVRAGRRPRRGWWSRSPGSCSRSSIVAVGGELFMLAMIGLGVLGLREFFRMTARAPPGDASRLPGGRGDGDRRALRQLVPDPARPGGAASR